MLEHLNKDLRRAAKRVNRWDKVRHWAGEMDLNQPRDMHGEYDALATLISLQINSKARRVSAEFCRLAAVHIGAEQLEHADMISPTVPSGEPKSGYLLKFPNGLILGSVNAAKYILELTGKAGSESQQNPLQTLKN